MKDTERLQRLYRRADISNNFTDNPISEQEFVAEVSALLDEARSDELEAAIQQFLFGADNFSKYADARTKHLSKLKQERSTE